MSDFSVHRIIGRGGFGEVFGCRKVDTGKMYAMKCLGMIHYYHLAVGLDQATAFQSVITSCFESLGKI